MRKPIFTALATAALLLGATLSSSTMAAETQFISIGTGGVTGVYYPTGGAICRLVNKNRKETGIRCSVESTGGSAFNVNAIRQGELEMGVAQSDVQYNAIKVSRVLKMQVHLKILRSVFSVHAEPGTLVVRADAGIKDFGDIKGKRVNIGEPGSGTVATYDIIAKAYGMTRSDLKLASELKSQKHHRHFAIIK